LSTSLTPGQTLTTTVFCPAGKVATGGGFALSSLGNTVAISNNPVSTGNGWRVTGAAFGELFGGFTVFVVCVNQ
jgi:hypothetical protein